MPEANTVNVPADYDFKAECIGREQDSRRDWQGGNFDTNYAQLRVPQEW
jgi:hypothetical protein